MSEKMANYEVPNMGLTKEFLRLAEQVKEIGYGEATIIIKHGKPVMLHKVREDVKLDD